MVGYMILLLSNSVLLNCIVVGDVVGDVVGEVVGDDGVVDNMVLIKSVGTLVCVLS